MKTITKQECLNLLFELREEGVNCDTQIKQLLIKPEPDIELIKFINSHRELDIRKFYEKLRKSYNNNKSKLYINIVQHDKLSPQDIMTCIGALLQQILLFNKTINNKSFLKQARMNEILICLEHYYTESDIVISQRLLSLIKSDLKILEIISKEG